MAEEAGRMQSIEDEELLLAVLNSSPVVGGRRIDGLVGDRGADLARENSGTGSEVEIRLLQTTRDTLQQLVRGEAVEAQLDAVLSAVRLVPTASRSGLRWSLDAPPDGRLAARVVIAWSRVQERLPGRLRACANVDCNLFLIDHSRPGTARWCSMTTCGNRMKARAHATRQRHVG